jgi:MFS family permease
MHLVPDDQMMLTDDDVVLGGDSIETATLTSQSRRISIALTFLAICVALLMTGFGIILPIFPQRLEALGLGAGTLALMEVGFGLGMFIFSTPMGILANRIGRKPIVFISLAGFIVTNLALAVVNVPLLFILIRFIEGALISGLMPAAMAMVGDSVRTEHQGRWIGFITTAQATGTALGPGIGGFLYQLWGGSRPFLLTAGIALTAALIALFVLPETLPEAVRVRARLPKASKLLLKQQSPDNTSSIRHIVWMLAPLLLIDFGLTFIYPFVLPQYPFYLVNVLKYSSAQFGVIVSAYGLSLAVFPLVLGRLSEILSKKLLIIIGSLLFSALNVAMLCLHPYPLLVGSAVVTGIGDALLLPALGAIYLGSTTEQNRSQVMGVRGSAISLGVLLGPLMQALASYWITPQATFAIAVALTMIIVFIIIVGYKHK